MIHVDHPIQQYLLDKVEAHPSDLVKVATLKFGVPRQTVHRHIKKLMGKGILGASGRTRARRYNLVDIVQHYQDIDLSKEVHEDSIWREHVEPKLGELPKNLRDICYYGFTEILNNAIDHSHSEHAFVSVNMNAKSISLLVLDEGIGIFNKIAQDLGLEHKRDAILELSKGKLTTDPERHSGEGIFFTSRVFDRFAIVSGELSLVTTPSDRDWLFEAEDVPKNMYGTLVSMQIQTDSLKTIRDIFKRFEDDDSQFKKTMVPVKLAQYEGESLISRSQAKRLYARFENFSEVMLDFEGVHVIGQGFADELFRVFRNNHPHTHLVVVNVSEEVKPMIAHVVGGMRGVDGLSD